MAPAVAVARDCASRVCNSRGVSRGFGQAATERATKGKRTKKREGLMQILKAPNRTMIRRARADMRHINEADDTRLLRVVCEIRVSCGARNGANLQQSP